MSPTVGFLSGKVKDKGGENEGKSDELGGARAKKSGQLVKYERRYRELAGQLANVGLISIQVASLVAAQAAAPRGASATPTRPSCTARTTSGRPRRTARPSPGGSAQPRRRSTESGSTMTVSHDSSSSRCAS